MLSILTNALSNPIVRSMFEQPSIILDVVFNYFTSFFADRARV